MVLKAITSDSSGSGVRVDMASGDLLLVTEDAVVVRTDAVNAADAAIRAFDNSNTLDIRGGVVSGGTAIMLGNDPDSDHTYAVRLGSEGFVKSFWGAGIRVSASNSKIINAGNIQGENGIEITGIGNESTSSQIVNSGVIEGSNYFGILRSEASTDPLYLENTGSIIGRVISFDGSDAVETIVNKGHMSGDILLGDGADIYDGREGSLIGKMFGEGGNDKIYGSAHDDYLSGDDGNDIISAGAGNDTLFGGIGKDNMKGGSGNDVIDGGADADRMEGGSGNDIYVVYESTDVIVERAGEGMDKVFSAASYSLSANVENLELAGNANLAGTGNELANVLTGNAGSNTLKGGAGDDTLTGGAGADKLYGGTGKDMFVFASITDSKASARDTIFDFSQSQGDRVDLSGIDASTLSSGNQAFSFIGTSAFQMQAGELRFEQKSGDTFVTGDINGDGNADFSIAFDAAIMFKAGDFLL